jgi:hypothetical protein
VSTQRRSAPLSPPKSVASAASSVTAESVQSPVTDSVTSIAHILPSLDSQVSFNPDGSCHVTFLMDANMTRRYKSRAQSVPLERYIWDNVLRAALESHVY